LSGNLLAQYPSTTLYSSDLAQIYLSPFSYAYKSLAAILIFNY